MGALCVGIQRLSAPLVAAALRAQGATAHAVDGAEVIVTDIDAELAIAGDASVLAVDIDPVCEAACRLNAAANGLTLAVQIRDLVGSYQGVQMEELLPDRPIESIDKLLEGQVAGVRIISNTGEPGLPVQAVHRLPAPHSAWVEHSL